MDTAYRKGRAAASLYLCVRFYIVEIFLGRGDLSGSSYNRQAMDAAPTLCICNCKSGCSSFEGKKR